MTPLSSRTLSSSTSQIKRESKMPNSPSTSLNHLLNFSLPPRQTSVFKKPGKRLGSSARNSERFVNAQYRFIMKPFGNYSAHFSDPDIFFQWQDVLQVLIPQAFDIATSSSNTEESLVSCPICLSPPTAPRMTRCGHVFCYPCILHYLNTSEIADKWIRCPICFDSINEKQLKAVKWFDNRLSTIDHVSSAGSISQLDVSSTSKDHKSLCMRLIQRPRITTLALPRSATWPSAVLSPHQAPFHFLPDVYTFSRFMLATPAYLIENLNQDLVELDLERSLLLSMKDELGVVFVEAAERKVHSQMESTQNMDTEALRQMVAKVQNDLDCLIKQEERVKGSQIPGESELETPEELLSLNPFRDKSHVPSQRHQSQHNAPTTNYYYYQSAFGSPIFLHPLDTRILLSHFDSYAAFPNEITVQVEAYSEGSVNEDLRRRCKFLALPDGADVVFVETNLEPVVGPGTLKTFEAALDTRRSKRKEKAKRDDRAKLHAEEKERERICGSASQFTTTDLAPRADDWSTTSPLEFSRPENELSGQTERTSGAWGSRSFASALSSRPSNAARVREERVEDEWDLDLAWHDIEQRGGRKRGRNQKLIILGGGASGARRHR